MSQALFNRPQKTSFYLTFATKQNLPGQIKTVTQNCQVEYSKIFVLENAEEQSEELFCTYNAQADNINSLDSTLRVQRNKSTNTIYTIDALNELIKHLNNGVLDKTFIVPWERIKESLVLIRNEKLKIIKTKIFDVIHLR